MNIGQLQEMGERPRGSDLFPPIKGQEKIITTPDNSNKRMKQYETPQVVANQQNHMLITNNIFNQNLEAPDP